MRLGLENDLVLDQFSGDVRELADPPMEQTARCITELEVVIAFV